ncbi:MAG: 1,6-anhydro-N-acetylmuramyl-L-alanine amidase AmpD [Thioalkalispiraceae bacterium]|jgi:AmpD protein
MQIINGILSPAIQLDSPNCDDRPDSDDISLLVIHGISLPPGEFGGGYIEQFFTNQLDPAQHPYFEEIRHLQVSSHLLISRDGIITQFVPFHKRAWHAGESCYKDRQRCNDYSIGIELEGTDDQPYTDAQYQALNSVIAVLQASYPRLTTNNIVGHCHIAPRRKTDPGPAFEWSRINNTENKIA